MHRRASILAALIALSLLAQACNGGDGSELPPTPSATLSETPTERPTASVVSTPQPSPTATTETPASGETPTAEPTATPAPSPLPAGTPAVAPADLSLYEGKPVDQEDCLFDPRTALANCFDRGLYSVVPPLTGEDISCSILIVDDEAVVVFCRSEEAQQAMYYAIQ